MLKMPPRVSGVRRFNNGLSIKTNTKLLCEETGGDVWRGAIALSEYLKVDEPQAVKDKAVIELASGTGLLGLSISLAPASAGSVLVTDQECMLGLLKENIGRNGALLPHSVRAAVLDWGVQDLDPCVAEGAPYDVIVLSDVFYDEDLVQPLITTLRRLCIASFTGRFPSMYLCASHRTERLEGMFFTSIQHYFDSTEVTNESSMASELRREFISIWRLCVRDGVGTQQLGEGLVVTLEPCSTQLEASSELQVPHHQLEKLRPNLSSGEGVCDDGVEVETKETQAPVPSWLRDDVQAAYREAQGLASVCHHFEPVDLEELD